MEQYKIKFIFNLNLKISIFKYQPVIAEESIVFWLDNVIEVFFIVIEFVVDSFIVVVRFFNKMLVVVSRLIKLPVVLIMTD